LYGLLATAEFQGQKVKGQGHQAALLGAVLTCKAAAGVSRMYSAWESTATLRLLGGTQGAWAPMGRRGAGAYCVTMRTACYDSVKCPCMTVSLKSVHW